MVSIIVLTYNHEKYIRQALDSILMQNVDFRYEILIGDDASTDGTQDILREYKRNHPDLFVLYLREKNLGPTRNSYELLMAAKGKYIATCEGDDYWIDPEKLKIQVSFLEKHSEFIGCSHTCLVVDRNGNKTRLQRLRWIFSGKEMRLENFKGYFLPGQVSTIVRRNIYKTEEDFSIFYKASANIGDRTTALVYLAKGKFFIFERIMGAYRRGAGGAGLTKSLYFDNKYRVRDDFEYTKKLACYAETVLCVDGGFEYHYRDLFVSAAFGFLRKPSKEGKILIREILCELGERNKVIIWFPAIAIKKTIEHFNTI